MPFVNNSSSGWAVVRNDSGQVVAVYPSEEEANAKARELGDGYDVRYGRSDGGDFDEAL